MRRYVTKKKVRYEHINATFGEKFIKPTRVILLTSIRACGHCPMSLFCQRDVSWEPILKRYTLFICRRCYVLGFAETEKYISTRVKELYICTLLRTKYSKKPWKANHSQWIYSYSVNKSIGICAIGLYYEDVKEIPYSCIARCRRKKIIYTTVLSPSTDCRTTLNDAVGEVIRW